MAQWLPRRITTSFVKLERPAAFTFCGAPAAFDAWAEFTQILPVQGRIDRPASHDMISRPVFMHPAIDVQALPTVGPQSPPDVVAVLDRIQRRLHRAGC